MYRFTVKGPIGKTYPPPMTPSYLFCTWLLRAVADEIYVQTKTASNGRPFSTQRRSSPS